MDWAGIFGTLKEGGYEGCVTMESFVRMGNHEICVWRNIVQDVSIEAMIQAAADGANFVRGMLQK
jgi:sugar phosphate isomerase/epimerase